MPLTCGEETVHESIESLRKCTEPSQNAAFTPPGWKLIALKGVHLAARVVARIIDRVGVAPAPVGGKPGLEAPVARLSRVPLMQVALRGGREHAMPILGIHERVARAVGHGSDGDRPLAMITPRA